MAQYDSALQMFVEEAHELDMSVLAFLRFLAQTGRFDDDMGTDSGED